MISILFFYFFLPLLTASLVVRFIRKYGASQIPVDVTTLLAVDPIERRWFRAARRDEKGLFKLSDYEGHQEAVDAIYAARQQARDERRKGAFIVLDDKGETLDWIDA